MRRFRGLGYNAGMSDVTRILAAIEHGDLAAADEQLPLASDAAMSSSLRCSIPTKSTMCGSLLMDHINTGTDHSSRSVSDRPARQRLKRHGNAWPTLWTNTFDERDRKLEEARERRALFRQAVAYGAVA
jgi:hypothetical protein